MDGASDSERGSVSPARKNHKRKRIVKYFFVFNSVLVSGGDGPPDKRTIKATKRFDASTADDEPLDENSVALLCLPDGITVVNVPIDPKFHFFVITQQDGCRIYGSSLSVWERVKDVGQTPRPRTSIRDNKYASKAYCLLTTIPFVVAAKRLLVYFWKCSCDPSVVDTVCNLKLPSKGKSIRIRLPPLPEPSLYDVDRETFGFSARELNEIFVYRGITELPLFDHSLRELFIDVLSPDQFFKAFAALLLEFQVLIVSEDYYKLMLVAESLIALLLPFKWQHVVSIASPPASSCVI